MGWFGPGKDEVWRQLSEEIGAEFVEGGLIVMGADDVREVVARVPTVIAVHMEALNHCFLERESLRSAVPGVLVPEDGETLEV